MESTVRGEGSTVAWIAREAGIVEAQWQLKHQDHTRFICDW
jgi:hypothetical protein